ncbi:PI-actitoxin-Afv2b-like [Haematobia irritans]|uniref:PI-actitoxin-Afv2b-like n=1 Tax=Haematobia irritans TaxID=7368 RepID=UPI003F502B47
MKLIFAILFLAIFVIVAEGQCHNNPARPRCRQPLHLGRGGRGCRRVARWWYDNSSGVCKEFTYRGCGGNNNRYCSKAACETGCRRLIP